MENPQNQDKDKGKGKDKDKDRSKDYKKKEEQFLEKTKLDRPKAKISSEVSIVNSTSVSREELELLKKEVKDLKKRIKSLEKTKKIKKSCSKEGEEDTNLLSDGEIEFAAGLDNENKKSKQEEKTTSYQEQFFNIIEKVKTSFLMLAKATWYVLSGGTKAALLITIAYVIDRKWQGEEVNISFEKFTDLNLISGEVAKFSYNFFSLDFDPIKRSAKLLWQSVFKIDDVYVRVKSISTLVGFGAGAVSAAVGAIWDSIWEGGVRAYPYAFARNCFAMLGTALVCMCYQLQQNPDGVEAKIFTFKGVMGGEPDSLQAFIGSVAAAGLGHAAGKMVWDGIANIPNRMGWVKRIEQEKHQLKEKEL